MFMNKKRIIFLVLSYMSISTTYRSTIVTASSPSSPSLPFSKFSSFATFWNKELRKDGEQHNRNVIQDLAFLPRGGGTDDNDGKTKKEQEKQSSKKKKSINIRC